MQLAIYNVVDREIVVIYRIPFRHARVLPLGQNAHARKDILRSMEIEHVAW